MKAPLLLFALALAAVLRGEESRAFRIVQVTDTHVIDEESPARWIKFRKIQFNGMTIDSSFRSWEDTSCQLLDAFNRTVNRRHRSGTPVSLLLHTGDMIDNDQGNELTWFARIMKGGIVDPDSGADEDPLPGPGNDPNDPFTAQGLDPSIPWVGMPGNHDLEGQGNVLPSQADLFRQLALGMFAIPAAEGNFSRAMLVPRSPLLPPLTDAEVRRLPPGIVPADAGRAWMEREGFVRTFLAEFGGQEAHGFSACRVDEMDYSFRPRKDLPLRVIVLDTVNTYSGICEGVYDKRKVERFLKPELDKALAQHEVVVLTSHHPPSNLADARILDISTGSIRVRPYQPGDWMTAADCDQLLASYPNVVLWLAGHTHRNVVTPHARPQGEPWYEIETNSLFDFPQEARSLTLNWKAPGTLGVALEMVAVDEGLSPLVDRAREMSRQAVAENPTLRFAAGQPGDRDGELEIHYGFTLAGGE